MTHHKRKSMDLTSIKSPQKNFRLNKTVYFHTNKVNLSPKINYVTSMNKANAI